MNLKTWHNFWVFTTNCTKSFILRVFNLDMSHQVILIDILVLTLLAKYFWFVDISLVNYEPCFVTNFKVALVSCEWFWPIFWFFTFSTFWTVIFITLVKVFMRFKRIFVGNVWGQEYWPAITCKKFFLFGFCWCTFYMYIFMWSPRQIPVVNTELHSVQG